jgi:hypothetical protein
MEEIRTIQLFFFVVVMLGVGPITLTLLTLCKTKKAAEIHANNFIANSDYETAEAFLSFLAVLQVLTLFVSLYNSIRIHNQKLFYATSLFSLISFLGTFACVFVSFAGGHLFYIFGLAYSGFLMIFSLIAQGIPNRNSLFERMD